MGNIQMVPVDDTALAMTDSGGTGQAIVYLNGAYADQRPWRPVIEALGNEYRHIGYDERARGRSKQSADYSFEGTLRDLDAILEATGVDKPILVGWSYGATIAAHWAARYPDRVLGVVNVDGAMPYGLTGEEGQERIRKLFHKMRFILPLARPFGMAARMSAAMHAEVNIEINEIVDSVDVQLDQVTCPVRYVLATGSNLGGGEEEMEAARASLNPVLERNPNIQVSAKVPSNHSKILKKDFKAIAQAVRETIAAATHKENV